MLGPILLFLLVIPVIEIYVFMRVGSAFGVANTIFLLVIMAILGVGLAKSQGQALVYQSRAALARGEMPAGAGLHGMLIFFGGILIFVPGFFTDVIGFLLVLPGTRHVIAFLMGKLIARQVRLGRIKVFGASRPFQTEDQSARARDVSPQVIDVTPISSSRTDGGKGGSGGPSGGSTEG